MMHNLMHIFTEWLLLYGGVILFFMLVLGIVGLPIPDETLLILSGWLVAKEKLDALPVLIGAITGSICGISLSYWVGRNTGSWLIKKYGRKLNITEKKIKRVHDWYQSIGKWMLCIGYFIPLVRHLTGYVAGSLELEVKEFMLYAYSGAIIWSLTFLSIGYFFLIEIKP